MEKMHVLNGVFFVEHLIVSGRFCLVLLMAEVRLTS